MKRFVHIKLEWEGIHYYKDAPEKVAFLAHPHRHLFKCEIELQVFDHDREYEFLIIKQHLQEAVIPELKKERTWSCERMAEFIGEFVRNSYTSGRELKVSVFEDGENGGIAQWQV